MEIDGGGSSSSSSCSTGKCLSSIVYVYTYLNVFVFYLYMNVGFGTRREYADVESHMELSDSTEKRGVFGFVIEEKDSVCQEVMEWALDLIEENTKVYYNTTGGFDRSFTRDELTELGIQFLIASLNGDRVGFIAFKDTAKDRVGQYANIQKHIFVYQLQICRAHQRKNLGRDLITTVSNVARNLKYKRVRLECHTVNSSAISFYNSCCFVSDLVNPEFTSLYLEIKTSSSGTIYIHDAHIHTYTHYYIIHCHHLLLSQIMIRMKRTWRRKELLRRSLQQMSWRTTLRITKMLWASRKLYF